MGTILARQCRISVKMEVGLSKKSGQGGRRETAERLKVSKQPVEIRKVIPVIGHQRTEGSGDVGVFEAVIGTIDAG